MLGRYVVFGDPADGGGDYCAAHVLRIDVAPVEQVAVLHSCHWDAAQFGEKLVDIAETYNNALLGWEDNNMGRATGVVITRERRYAHVYHRQEYDPAKQNYDAKVGWLTTVSTRPQMLGGLQAALRDGALLVHDAATFSELRMFAYNKSGKPEAPQGQHDDLVMSLAGAWEMVQHARLHSGDFWFG